MSTFYRIWNAHLGDVLNVIFVSASQPNIVAVQADMYIERVYDENGVIFSDTPPCPTKAVVFRIGRRPVGPYKQETLYLLKQGDKQRCKCDFLGIEGDCYVLPENSLTKSILSVAEHAEEQRLNGIALSTRMNQDMIDRLGKEIANLEKEVKRREEGIPGPDKQTTELQALISSKRSDLALFIMIQERQINNVNDSARLRIEAKIKSFNDAL